MAPGGFIARTLTLSLLLRCRRVRTLALGKVGRHADDTGSQACRDGPGVARGSPSRSGPYLPYKISGNTLYLSGQGPLRTDGTFATGKVGRDVTIEQAYEHAKLVGLGLLAAARRLPAICPGSRC